ncbi:MAG: L,D-transpeptidase family protein [Sphingomicrobium sp.]
MRHAAFAFGLAITLIAAPAIASGSKVSSPLALAKQADKLKPGDWVWAGNIAPHGPVLVYVELNRQLATVYRNGVRIAVSTVSSGKVGFDTPGGVFTILEKDIDHRSRTYDNAPMPFQQRLTWKGVAMHAGNLPGYPASHGCIRLPLEFSKLLFKTTTMGGTVVIANSKADPYKRPPAGVLAPQTESGKSIARLPLQNSEAYRWTPEAAPTGPVSIIISTGDQLVVVLRNGVEIGRAKAVVAAQDSESQVLTLAKDTRGRNEWIQVGVNNLKAEDAAIVSTQGVERMQLPEPFVARMRAAMGAGTTVLITSASVDAKTTGVQTTVIASEQ